MNDMEAYYIVKAIVCAKVNPNRVFHRDTQSYFGILLDDNNRKPICRLRYNGKKRFVSFFDTGKEQKIEIQTNNQLYEHTSRFIKSLDLYEKNPSAVSVAEA